MKKSQYLMIWFLPVILICGLFVPVIGYLVVAMMLFFLVLSFSKGRYWCWNLCPRGAFLDIAMSKISRNKPLPQIFMKPWFRWLIFSILMLFLVFRLFQSRGDLVKIGQVFVNMCIITTLIAVVLGFFLRHRAWCIICPMGNLQEQIHKLKSKKH